MKDLGERIESMGRDMGIHETNLQRFRYKLEDFAREMFEAGRNSKGVEIGSDSSWNHTGACQTNCTCSIALAASAEGEKA